MIDSHIQLPPLPGAADGLFLGEVEEEEEGLLALTTFGQRRRLALCSPRRSQEWTIFGGLKCHSYDGIVYSSIHKRLFCVSIYDNWARHENGSMSRVECWNLGNNQCRSPALEWVIEHNRTLDFETYFNQWPARSCLKKACFQMKYLVCNEDSGDLFVVVRHVNPRAGPLGSITTRVVLSTYRGRHYVRTPYKTIEFDVLKVDFERGELIPMKDSLGGLAMFVGINHPFAISSAAATGVRPDCVYFTDENRLVGPTRLERTSYGAHDNGIFDYQTKEFYSCCDLYPMPLNSRE